MATSAPTLIAPRETVRRPAMLIYLLSLVAGGALMLIVLAGSLLALKATDHLPPPQFSNSLCVDEKLLAMRHDPPVDPNFLVVGSSVAWRHFNGTAATAQMPALRPYNAGFCGARISETYEITQWLVGRLPSVRHVLLIASPLDFENCSKDDPTQFSIGDTDQYVFGGGSPSRYYARYFDPVTLLANARIVRDARTDVAAMDPLVQDRYGSAPAEPTRSRGLFYGRVQPDPACFAALRAIAQSLEGKNIAFDLAMSPVHPGWERKYGGPRFWVPFDRRIAASLAGTHGRLLHVAYRPATDAWYDAVHVRWSATPALTRAFLAAS
ncbi:hypothetical protein [Sphingomonas oryzagri]|uniref:SGNH/GDSL hydrolase family protein n=1 Tax=Sphingomonas oryzagri TaxID=3042314 RepID=A0ABT6N1R7_9SPHN|nr:hypothetical protein [Sphingomonas oryzagri]MDH7639200.1 hypothetical protein [Sphingomonas oryzagri]